jgi:hypothetical protein
MEKTFEEISAERKQIRNRFSGIEFPDPVMETLWYGRRPTELVPEKKVIVDQNKKTIFAIASDKYKIVHYEDVLGMVDNIVSQIEGFGQINLCPDLLSEGGKMKVILKFPEAEHLIQTGNNIIPKIEVMTSYDLKWKLSGRFGAFQLRCKNGMGTWKMFHRFARRHLLNLNLDDLKNTITEGLTLFGFQIEEWRSWAQAKLSNEAYNTVWEELPFSAAEREKIELLPEIGTGLMLKQALEQKSLTVWDMNSILTQFNTHEIGSDIRKINNEPEIARVMENLHSRIIH